MIKNGVYAAGLSILKEDLSLDIESTISHAESIIKNGLHGVFFFGSTGQSQLISISEKKELISKTSTSKFKNQFYIGTGVNSLKDNIDIIRYYMNNATATRKIAIRTLSKSKPLRSLMLHQPGVPGKLYGSAG